MNLRKTTIVLGVVCLAYLAAGTASATSFIDVSSMTGSYLAGYPMGVCPGGAPVQIKATTQYYATYLYSGGSAGTFTNITSYAGGTNRTYAASENQSGQSSITSNNAGIGAAYLYSGGTTSLTVPVPAADTISPTGYLYPTAYGVDNAGEVFGQVGFGASTSYISYVYSGGTSHPLADPLYATAGGNGYGAVVAAASPNGNYAVGAWLYTPGAPTLPARVAGYWLPNGGSWANGGTFTSLGLQMPGSGGNIVYSVALAVNNSGQAVVGRGAGISDVALGNYYIYQIGAGTFTQMSNFGLAGSPGSSESMVGYVAGLQSAINTTGQVAGYELVSSVKHAAIWQNGAITDLNTVYGSGGLNILPTNFVMNVATAVDDNGDIAGFGTDGSGHTNQAFVIVQPVPEPATLLLAASGLAGLLVLAWRNRG